MRWRDPRSAKSCTTTTSRRPSAACSPTSSNACGSGKRSSRSTRDQTRGLPKTSESRGTEAILNALILSTRDSRAGALSEDGKQAFANLWPLQFKNGDLKGAWAWLNFHYEPWESADGTYFGAALAAVAAGSAPGAYATTGDVQEPLKLLRAYLQEHADKQSLFNRAMALWASGSLPDVLTTAQRKAIVEALCAAQRSDGGWATAALGEWKRQDATPLDPSSDGYATGLVTLALQRAGLSRVDPHVAGGLAWLTSHQDGATGMWLAVSLNKQRDPASDPGKFMSDAATGYAVLALTDGEMGRREWH